MCTALLSPGVNPIAVNKYIISYIKFHTRNFANNIWPGLGGEADKMDHSN